MSGVIIQRPTDPWGYVVDRGSKTYPGPLYRRRFEINAEPEFDAEALAYITAVETADGQALETGVRIAINNFVVGCKQDGIWNAIKASCILAGARTLAGALVPLVGTAPTNFNFDSEDYNRKTGLKGNGSDKYLASNRNNNADPKDNKHLSVYISTFFFREIYCRPDWAAGIHDLALILPNFWQQLTQLASTLGQPHRYNLQERPGRSQQSILLETMV